MIPLQSLPMKEPRVYSFDIAGYEQLDYFFHANQLHLILFSF
ncbi:hypothetical protein COO91_10973 (plasmid) [Nostoc flagelliforme CCNUN1]|uniref:Uncharacterized protein n=1 Tax=Nostoc flagelliforme CCNUN1 TaxID=2038116 RepID=A0A2K8TAW5_9NOSO|nr:hypothetical protein COO91_10973 [Nostoc flagelliforme CCNUN1]